MKSFHCAKCVLLAALFVYIACAANSPFASASSARDLYQQMLTKLRSVKSYQVTIEDTTILQPTAVGAKARRIQSTDEVWYVSPNYFHLKNDGLMGGATIVSNGKEEFFYSDLTDEYASQAAPKDIVGSVMGGLQGRTVVWSSAAPTVVDGIAVRELTGVINGQRGVTRVTLYIKQTDMLPYQVYISLPSVSSATGNGLLITRTETFTGQKLNAPIPESTFEFTPPDGATKVNSPADLASGFGGGGLG